ncbi:uncharacterized protein F5147DRAFT_656310 [Suillus discolor]|uniref:Uncharacterized protein n=1 Tax=Suillus discolor TaxID=1912936 RepID=A0A9P7EZX6_9AGAM|nr:uncharacterized protein F5147DRAFT_656310 [Suillus discolor]KAG2097498.1 hypothetical protein F5147DRAFT_656310 [Suillus discolor]
MEDHPGPEDGDTGVKADDGEEVVVYVGVAKTWGRGTMFMKQFKSDTYTEERVSNPYFPFTGKPDWEMAAFLLQSDSAWQTLMSSSSLNFFDFIPHKVYVEAEHAIRVDYGFMTGDHAWEPQEDLPDGMTLLGVVLSSDKTKVSNLAGNCYAHPLLITLANINPDDWLGPLWKSGRHIILCILHLQESLWTSVQFLHHLYPSSLYYPSHVHLHSLMLDVKRGNWQLQDVKLRETKTKNLVLKSCGTVWSAVFDWLRNWTFKPYPGIHQAIDHSMTKT